MIIDGNSTLLAVSTNIIQIKVIILKNFIMTNIPDNSVDMCVTSPPYYNLIRLQKLSANDLIKTLKDFVENLCKVI